MLYPQENVCRELRLLDGLWNLKIDTSGMKRMGRQENWQKAPLPNCHNNCLKVPVPASFNDLYTDIDIRDHVGDVWYETTFYCPESWSDSEVVVQFGSVTHHAIVYINGHEVTRHKGGFLSFNARLTAHLNPAGEANRLTICVDNTLDDTCLPLGSVNIEDDGRAIQDIQFDFFNYAGIMRSVKLQKLPKNHITDLWLNPEVNLSKELGKSSGMVKFQTAFFLESEAVKVCRMAVRISNPQGKTVAATELPAPKPGAWNQIDVGEVELWGPGKGLLYRFEAFLLGADGQLIDTYTESIGFRSIEVTKTSVLINGEAVHFKGFGKHEDSFPLGRAHHPAMMIKDFSLLKWMGANCFRTAHYPYDEEVMRYADEQGIMIIDETAAVGMQIFGGSSTDMFADNETTRARQKHHSEHLEELIRRDKNHPSVIMWSITNEPYSRAEGAKEYFAPLFEQARKLDPTRPMTSATCEPYDECQLAPLCDVICLNRYPGWYNKPGRLDIIQGSFAWELDHWFEKHQKPIMLSEFGSETIPGLHLEPAEIFSEEYQVRFLELATAAIDEREFCCGEHIWNFADFKTKQGITRVNGNRKGVFTRERQPKMSAHFLRKRWLSSPLAKRPAKGQKLLAE